MEEKTNKQHDSIWLESGKDKDYEARRISTRSAQLRKWVDDAYYANGLANFLDKNFVSDFRNGGFYARLWELELAEWFMLLGLTMIPTKGKGPDFCIELDNGRKLWVEAVITKADEELEENWRQMFTSKGIAYNTPRQKTALRYSSSLTAKAKIIKEKYLSEIVGKDDYVLIAVSAFPPGAMRSDIDLFMLSVLPIEHQIIYFPTNGKPLDESIIRQTHTVNREYTKKNGSSVPKDFLYPGDECPFIDGVLFSEASNLQQLLGTYSSGFDKSTNRPHIFANYSGKKLPRSFTDGFYYHEFSDNGEMSSLEMHEPLIPIPE